MNPVGTLETAKAANPLTQLQTFGQSIWLDYIRRDLLLGGELQRLISDDGLRGMTSNPAIFEKAIAGSTQYQDFLDSLAGRTDLDAKGRYELLAIRDIKAAADIRASVYRSTKKRDRDIDSATFRSEGVGAPGNRGLSQTWLIRIPIKF